MTSQLPEELVPRGMPSMRLCKACRMEMLVWQGINVGILTVSVKFIPLKFSVHSCRSLLFLSPPPLSLSLSLSLLRYFPLLQVMQSDVLAQQCTGVIKKTLNMFSLFCLFQNHRFFFLYKVTLVGIVIFTRPLVYINCQAMPL